LNLKVTAAAAATTTTTNCSHIATIPSKFLYHIGHQKEKFCKISFCQKEATYRPVTNKWLKRLALANIRNQFYRDKLANPDITFVCCC